MSEWKTAPRPWRAEQHPTFKFWMVMASNGIEICRKLEQIDAEIIAQAVNTYSPIPGDR